MLPDRRRLLGRAIGKLAATIGRIKAAGAATRTRVRDRRRSARRRAHQIARTLRAELAVVRERYNGVRLHGGIGYVTPNDEHEGRGPAIRKARQAGLKQARLRRIAYHRANPTPNPTVDPEHDLSEEPGDVG